MIAISWLRDSLGLACRLVGEIGEPLVVQHYRRRDVVIVPLWMWRELLELVRSPAEEPHGPDEG